MLTRRRAPLSAPAIAVAALICSALLLPMLSAAGEIACTDEGVSDSSTHPLSESEESCDHCAGCLSSHGHLLALSGPSMSAAEAAPRGAAAAPESLLPAPPSPDEIFHPPISRL